MSSNPLIPPSTIEGSSTPAAEWTKKTLDALDFTNPDSLASGATAHTGGFVTAGAHDSTPSTGLGSSSSTTAELEAEKAKAAATLEQATAGVSSSTSGFAGAGGMASNPFVPAPGTSINPATGAPHTAGLTRVELEAKKAEASLAEEKRLADLSGREQAARQLAGVTGGAGGVSTTTAAPSTAATSTPVKSTLASGRDRSHSPGSRSGGLGPSWGNEAPMTPGLITPGLELPGAWGPVDRAPLPGTAPNAPTSIYEDIGRALNGVGQVAYNAVPSPIKERLSNHQTPGSPTTGTTQGTPLVDQARSQANVLAQNASNLAQNAQSSAERMAHDAQVQAEKIAHDVQERANKLAQDVQNALHSDSSRTTTGEHGVLETVRGYLGAIVGSGQPTHAASELGVAHVPSMNRDTTTTTSTSTSTSAPSTSHSTAIAPATSLPSNETAGALPGQHSSGVGALPGPATETGVAILPEEKALEGKLGELSVDDSKPTIPGAELKASDDKALVPLDEVHPAVPASIVEAGEASRSVEPEHHTHHPLPTPPAPVVSEETRAPSHHALPTPPAPAVSSTSAPAHHVLPTPPAPVTAEHNVDAVQVPVVAPAGNAMPLISKDAEIVPTHTSKNLESNYGGLAPALPATYLGSGADHGATSLDLQPTDIAPPTSTTASAAPETSVLETGREISDSQTSSYNPSIAGEETTIPATRHAADRTNSMASVTAIRAGNEGSRPSPLANETLPESTEVVPTQGQMSTTRGTGPNHTVSLTPGAESEGLGHPSAVGAEGTTREPGSYPAAQHDHHDHHDHHEHEKSGNSLEGVKSALHGAGAGKSEDKAVLAGAPNFISEVDAPRDTQTFTPPVQHHSITPDNLVPVVPVKDAHTTHPVGITSTTSTSTSTSPVTSASQISPSATRTGHNGIETGHQRSGSNASTGSEKKKSGFLSKIKQKLKHHE